jgi:formamidopyrimidine-DNA glycosylase
MSGSLTVRPRGAALSGHDHVALHLDNQRSVVLNDPRRFGLMRVGRVDDFAELRNVGRDPLSTPLSTGEWRALVRSRRLPIKSLLMDQKLLAGIGNIYANEMLFQAGIRPRRRAANLRGRELERLDDAMRRVLGEAVRLGGSSISDFRDATGNPGYFQIQHAVYDRGGKPCPQCATPIRRVVLSGRSTFYCPSCQS